MSDGERHILVVANETAAGKAVADAVKRRAESGPVRVTVLAPVTQPSQGYVVYQDTRRAAAGRRLDRTVAKLREAAIPAQGLVVEADPVDALRDALHQLEPNEIIVSTHPQQQSGWLRRNKVEQMRKVAGELPFEHVVTDLRAEEGPANVLVVANQTVLDEPLLEKIRARAAKGPAAFLIVSPQGASDTSYDDAERRLRRAVSLLRSQGIDAHGQISHPDPYQAVKQAVDDERIDELIVSTFPGARSGWLRQNLVERLRKDVALPLEHVESEPASAAVTA
jgi:histidinol dehydrogenase